MINPIIDKYLRERVGKISRERAIEIIACNDMIDKMMQALDSEVDLMVEPKIIGKDVLVIDIVSNDEWVIFEDEAKLYFVTAMSFAKSIDIFSNENKKLTVSLEV